MPCHKHKHVKFEVCFQRSMNALKDGLEQASEGHPEMKRVASKLKKMNLTKLKAWEKELGSYAHEDMKRNW